MGISTNQWRVRIGCFCQQGRSDQKMQSGQTGQIKERPSNGHNMSVFVIALGALILLLQCGDVESNPGPKPDKEQTTSEESQLHDVGAETGDSLQVTEMF